MGLQFLIPIIASLVTGLAGRRDSNNPGETTTNDPTLQGLMPYMQEMFRDQVGVSKIQGQRYQQQGPLYETVLRMALGGMPKWARGDATTPAITSLPPLGTGTISGLFPTPPNGNTQPPNWMA